MSHLSSSVTSHLKAPNTTPVDAPEATVPADHVLVLKVIPLPGDANANGDIFGGWVMAQVDLAGSVLPQRISHTRMVTVAVNEFIFKQPVRVGDILSFYAGVQHVGRTSVAVDVEVFAERFSDQGKYVKVTEARLTYVAIDAAGKPQALPDTEQTRAWREAIKLQEQSASQQD